MESQSGERLLQLTLDHFVIGLTSAFLYRGALAIVPPQIDRRSDAAAVRTAHEILDLYDGSKFDVRFYMGLEYLESHTWRQGLSRYGQSMFRPSEEDGLLYLRPTSIRELSSDVPGSPEMWYELSHLYTSTFEETPRRMTPRAEFLSVTPSKNGIYI